MHRFAEGGKVTMDENRFLITHIGPVCGWLLLDLSRANRRDPYEVFVGFYNRRRDAVRAAKRIEAKEQAQ